MTNGDSIVSFILPESLCNKYAHWMPLLIVVTDNIRSNLYFDYLEQSAYTKTTLFSSRRHPKSRVIYDLHASKCFIESVSRDFDPATSSQTQFNSKYIYNDILIDRPNFLLKKKRQKEHAYWSELTHFSVTIAQRFVSLKSTKTILK